VSPQSTASTTGLRCRQIEATDIEAVAGLLARGFPAHDLEFWREAMAHLTQHEPPPNLPKYGYLLDSGGATVGALLMICSTVPGAAEAARCNLSSWYVEPSYRAYAPLLVSQAMRHKEVTYLNVSPAPHTWPIIEAQGFSRYCNGIFVGIPLLNGLFGGERVTLVNAARKSMGNDAAEAQILREHAAHGCVSLWCVAADGAAYPFVFRPRLAKGFIPCAQLIYCRDVADITRFGGKLGRYLARCGLPLVVIDSNGPVAGIAGVFRSGSQPKYFKGPQRPRLGDLAYTEYALLGV
jgi:hypothetical protein